MRKGKLRRNRLDERQEQKMLQIEHNGCWIAFWGTAVCQILPEISGPGGFGCRGCIYAGIYCCSLLCGGIVRGVFLPQAGGAA